MHIVLSVLTVIAAAASTATMKDRLPLEVDVRGDVSRYEAVMLWYGIRNDSTASQTVDLGYDRIGNFTFVLEGPDGSVQKRTPVVRPWDHGARLPTLTLAPGESYRQHIVLNEWLRFDQAGAYSLRIELTGQAASALSIVGDAARQVWIRPANPGQIDAKCKVLLNFLTGYRLRDNDYQAAVEELTWTRHPVAVPYLEEAIAAEVNPSLFEALVGIGTVEARTAVVRLTRHPTPWVANSARNALSRFGPGKLAAGGPHPWLGRHHRTTGSGEAGRAVDEAEPR